MKRILFTTCLLIAFISIFAAKVEKVEVFSVKMNKYVTVSVIVPDSEVRKTSIYLLHGYSGNEGSWLEINPQLVDYAEDNQVLIICPDAKNSWYWDSERNPDSQYETFVSKELVDYVDSHYNTYTDKNLRAIAGLSMGGHGAIWLAFRHADVFGSVGSLSGGLDIRPFPEKWEMKNQLGNYEENQEKWNQHTVINLIETIKDKQLNINVCCGVDDFFMDVNNAFHAKLLEHNIQHDYTVRPGKHDRAYWNNAIDYHLLFFQKVFDKHLKSIENK